MDTSRRSSREERWQGIGSEGRWHGRGGSWRLLLQPCLSARQGALCRGGESPVLCGWRRVRCGQGRGRAVARVCACVVPDALQRANMRTRCVLCRALVVGIFGVPRVLIACAQARTLFLAFSARGAKVAEQWSPGEVAQCELDGEIAEPDNALRWRGESDQVDLSLSLSSLSLSCSHSRSRSLFFLCAVRTR